MFSRAVSPFELAQIIGRLRAAYCDPPMSEDTAVLYTDMLRDLEYESTDAAVDDLIATMSKLPTVARIRRTVIEPTLDLPSAEEAWIAVQSRQSDTHELVQRAAFLMGGSFNIRTSSDPELTRVRFAKVYEELRRVAVTRALVAGLRARRMKLPVREAS